MTRRHRPRYFHLGRWQVSQQEKDRRLAAIRDVKALSPGELETYTAFLYQKMGYETRPRGGAGDGGVDIEAWRDGQKVVIQCKRYSDAVGPHFVRDLLGTVVKESASRGILVTTSTFTTAARETARGNPVELIDLQGLIDLQKLCKIGPFAEPDPPALAIPAPQPPPTPTRKSSGFAWWQWWVIVILSITACFVCSCAALAGLAAIGPPPS